MYIQKVENYSSEDRASLEPTSTGTRKKVKNKDKH